MNIKPLTLKIKKGHVTLEKQYVYCWFQESASQTFYVGATWIHPAARAALHLHASDDDARIVGIKLEEQGISLNEPMLILAFALPGGLNRKEAKVALISSLAEQNLLSSNYFGLPPGSSSPTLSSELRRWVDDAVQAIKIVRR